VSKEVLGATSCGIDGALEPTLDTTSDHGCSLYPTVDSRLRCLL
jgi:hypothetical protein